ncbi:MAG: hypothetical protein GX493_11330 [Firmicutes bacterium]|nr:hypothetical protein [Bacillota bacterium]
MATATAAKSSSVALEQVFRLFSGDYLLIAFTLGDSPVFRGRIGFATLDRAAAERWAAARGIPNALARMDRGERLIWSKEG